MNPEPQTAGWRHPAIAHFHTAVFLLWLVPAVAAIVCIWLRWDPWNAGSLAGRWLLIGATVSIIAGLARRLVLQNVATVVCLSTGLALLLLVMSNLTSFPFGPMKFVSGFGPTLPGGVPWVAPLLWVWIMITTRGVARLVLRPYRKTTYYGFWVMGVAAALAVGVDLSLEPMATRVLRWWMWETGGSMGTWYGAPWINFVGCALFILLLLAVNTPWLLNKQPVRQPTDYHPLVIWIAAHGLLISGNWIAGNSLAAGIGVLVLIASSFAAIRGGTW